MWTCSVSRLSLLECATRESTESFHFDRTRAVLSGRVYRDWPVLGLRSVDRQATTNGTRGLPDGGRCARSSGERP